MTARVLFRALLAKPRGGRYHLVIGSGDNRRTLCGTAGADRTQYIDAGMIDCQYCKNFLSGRVRKLLEEFDLPFVPEEIIVLTDKLADQNRRQDKRLCEVYLSLHDHYQAHQN